MALFAETLVEEWLNRKGYFTMRGVKVSRKEIDLLAVSPNESDGIHVEVSVGVNPFHMKQSLKEIEADAEDLVQRKYRDNRVAQRRETLWPGRGWRFMFVFGKRKPEELEFLSGQGVELVNIREVLTELRDRTPFTTSSEATDVADLIHFYCQSQQS